MWCLSNLDSFICSGCFECEETLLSLCVRDTFFLGRLDIHTKGICTNNSKVPCFCQEIDISASTLADKSKNMSQPVPPFWAHISIREIYYPPDPSFWLPSAFCVWGTERDMPLNLPPFMASPQRSNPCSGLFSIQRFLRNIVAEGFWNFPFLQLH